MEEGWIQDNREVGGRTAQVLGVIHKDEKQVPGIGTAGVATTTPTFSGFPAGVTSGTYNHLFDMTLASSYNPTFISNHGGTPAGAEEALATGMAAGKAYVNIHTTEYGGGEIRGFLQPIPEPTTMLLLGLGLVGLAGVRRSKK